MTKISNRNFNPQVDYRLVFIPVCVVVSVIISILAWVHFTPVLPATDLDSSWRWGIDDASLRHLSFGRDIVFTFGPLGFLYAGLHDPGHDTLYVVLSSLFCSGLVSGFVLTATRGRKPYLLLLPVLIANLAVRDAALFAVPISLVFASCRGNPPTLAWAIGIILVALVDGLLPLIKGTATLPVGFCTALAVVALFPRRPGWAVALPAITAATTLLAWVGSGQALANLPVYLSRQSEIARGYTEAMSVWGNAADLVVYIPVALLLATLAYRANPEHRLVRALAVLGICTVVLKAAFVRHDGHGFIAGSSLGLIGLLVFLHDDARGAALGLASGLLAWAVIAGTYVPADVRTVLSTFATVVSDSASGLAMRVGHPDRLFADYSARKAALKQALNLPQLSGTVDIYPTDTGALLASDLDWHPRPVIQSYSAYTPTLAALNARHLEGKDAPDTVLFSVGPIDGHYPNLEDGASWPGLLSHYDIKGRADAYVVLRRSSTDHHARIGTEISRGTYAFDTPISLPGAVPDIWATFKFHPLKTGQLLSVVFKRPSLFMDVTFVTGDHERFRMVAGMAEGFLLSPAIRSADDFVALAAGDEESLHDLEVQSISLHQDSTYPFWGATFDLVLAPLTVEPHPEEGH